MTYKFVTNEWLHIKNRGDVAYIQPPYDIDNPRTLVNQQVIINDKEYKCLGIETYSLPENIPYSLAFGILVEKQ